MSTQLRKAWAEGRDVRNVIAEKVAESFYRIIHNDGNKFRDERIAPNAKQRSGLVKAFEEFLGVSKGAGDRRDKPEIIIGSDGILPRIQRVGPNDLDELKDFCARLFNPFSWDSDSVCVLKERLLGVAESAIEHRKQFIQIQPEIPEGTSRIVLE